jgi:hypothetical protein
VDGGRRVRAAQWAACAGGRAVGARTDPRTGRFFRLLTLGPWAVLATIDLVWGGRRSGVERYVTPAWICAALAAAAFVATPPACCSIRPTTSGPAALAAVGPARTLARDPDVPLWRVAAVASPRS